jgi:hypothetical protein
MSLIRLIKALYAWIIYSVSMYSMYNKVLKALKPGTSFARQEVWILYVTHHSTLSYTDAAEIYDRCLQLPMKFNKRNAKTLTELVLKITASGYSPMCALSHKVIGSSVNR